MSSPSGPTTTTSVETKKSGPPSEATSHQGHRPSDWGNLCDLSLRHVTTVCSSASNVCTHSFAVGLDWFRRNAFSNIKAYMSGNLATGNVYGGGRTPYEAAVRLNAYKPLLIASPASVIGMPAYGCWPMKSSLKTNMANPNKSWFGVRTSPLKLLP